MKTSNSLKKSSLFKKSMVAIAFAALLTQGIVSCSSNDDDGGGTNPGSTTSTGVFLDCEVEGLTYQSGNNPPAQTDENGTFVYTPGETLSFSIGGVQLGTLTDGAPVCTPFDFVVPENIARFLQSLDGDDDPTNGIDVTAASTLLAGQNVTSDVFENPSSTGFAADTAVTNAIAAAEQTLLDTATTNPNLRNGTDSTFDPEELAGFAFIISSPLDAGFGIVKFDALANPGDQGSTASSTSFEDAVVRGGTGGAEDFSWVINAAGVMNLTFDDGSTATVRKSGSSSRAIFGVESEPGSPESVITLLKPFPITETDLSGAPVTPPGSSSRSYQISDPNGTETIVFTSDGTLSATGGADGPWSGLWTVSEIAPNVIMVVDGNSLTAVPGDWSLIVLLDGNLAFGGQLYVADVTFNGFDPVTQDPNFTWEDFFFLGISPN